MRRMLVPIMMLASACTFSIKLEATDDAAPADAAADSNMTIDARPVDAALPVDAGPDAMPMWVQLEVIDVPCDGTEVLSTSLLANGVSYRLRATGECVTNSGNNSRGDAEYAYNQFSNGSSSSGIDMGIAINDTTPADVKLPDWGNYTSTHMYTAMWTGLGARIVAKFHDPNYGNNSGALILHIDALQ